MNRRHPLTYHLLCRWGRQILDRTLEVLDFVSGIAQRVLVAPQAEQSPNEPGLVVVVDAEAL